MCSIYCIYMVSVCVCVCCDLTQVCQLCLDDCPQVIIDYCQTMFPSDLDLWAWLLEQLLGNMTTTDSHPSPIQDLYTSLYKG